MSQTIHTNYLTRLGALRTVPDIRTRVALLAMTSAAVVLPLFQIVIPATGQGRILDLGVLTGLGGLAPILVAVTAILVVAPIVPRLERLVRPADIGLAAIALVLAVAAWSGLGDAQESVERVAAFGALMDDRFVPVTSWRWGLIAALGALGLAVWRGALALTRPLHVATP